MARMVKFTKLGRLPKRFIALTESGKSPVKQAGALLVFAMLLAPALILILTSQSEVVSSPILVTEENSSENSPTNVFGNPSLPDWKDVTVENTPDFVIVNNADNLIFKFRKGTAGYNEVWQGDTMIVADERWVVEYLSKPPDTWKTRGEPQYVEWEQPENYHVIVRRFYRDWGEPETTFWMVYDFHGGFRPKISVEMSVGQADNYRIVWKATGINKTHVENVTNYVRFWNENESAIVFDYADVYEAFGDITEVEIEEWANDHKLNEYFYVGSLGIENFKLDPNFGYENVGASVVALGNTIRGSWFSCPEAGTADNITTYIDTSGGENVKCALYKKSDNSLVDNTEEWFTDGADGWHTFDFTTTVTLEATDYWIVAWADSTSVKIHRDSSNPGDELFKYLTYDDWPNPINPSTYAYKSSIYCTYTPLAAQWQLIETWTGTVSALAAPGKPILVSPENENTTYDNTPTFIWENGSGATSHRLVIASETALDNFGHENKGAIEANKTHNYLIGSWYSCPENGTATSITIYLKEYGVGTKIAAGIYSKSDNTLVGYTVEWAVTSGFDGWKELNITSGGDLQDDNYYLVFWKNGNLYTYNDTESGKEGYQSQTYDYPNWPATWSPSSSNEKHSIYCTYAHLENIYDNANAWDNTGTTIENELPVDNYWWKVAAVNAQGENWSENTWTFEIIMPPPPPTEYEYPIEQGFSLTGLVTSGAEFGYAIEQDFSLIGSITVGKEIAIGLSETFSLSATVTAPASFIRELSEELSFTATVVPQYGYIRGIAQEFFVSATLNDAEEYGRILTQNYSLIGVVAVSFEFSRGIPHGFSLGDEVAIEVERPLPAYSYDLSGTLSLTDMVATNVEYGLTILQEFSFAGVAIVPEYVDIYVSSPWCDNRANPTNVVVNPTFSAIYTVVDNNLSNPAQFIQIQVGTSWNDNDLWDNIATVTVENGQRSPDVSYDGMPLTLNSSYWWRCRLGDSNDNWTEWTSPQTFGYTEAPFDLAAAAMFIFPIVLMAMAFIFDNPVLAAFAGIVFILSGLFFIGIIWLGIIFVGIGVYLMIIAFLSEDEGEGG